MSDETKNDESVETSEDTAQIRAEIEETRAEMSETIDAIQAKLDPQHIKEEIKEKVHDATIGRVQNLAHTASEKVSPTTSKIGEAGRKLVELARSQPIAAAVGVGVAALLLGWKFWTSTHSRKVARR